MSGSFTDDFLLSIQGVTKNYGSLTALREVSLQIPPGEIFALLGANGAGKTTLIGCVCGLIQQFSGTILVAGHDVRRDYSVTRQLVGVVPQELNHDGFLDARSSLQFQGAYFGRRRLRERADELLRVFSLQEKAKVNSRHLSGGMKRRLMIGKALMHEPVLLFLDEPTAGVDVELRDELWEYIRELRRQGTTIVLTTHYLEEAERLADRVGIINRGRLLRVEGRDDLLRNFGRRWMEVALNGNMPVGLLGRLASLQPVQTAPNRFRVEFEDKEGNGAEGEPLQRLLTAVKAESLRIQSIEGGRSRLEDIFRELVSSDPGDKPRDDGPMRPLGGAMG